MTELGAGRTFPLRSFDLIDWAVVDSFQRVEVRGPHSLTNQILHVQSHLTYDQAHALAQAAWDGRLPQEGTFTVEESWG
ncbi:hypothetical protein [Deinococcus hohokamensis]|uniref:Uncharacterized protein n=1 Tax=Deinococcus hohokamensis TaxID=309883 RepID=A0ABV9I497_9DEIO